MTSNIRAKIRGAVAVLTLWPAAGSAQDLFGDAMRVGRDRQRIAGDERRIINDAFNAPGRLGADLSQLNRDEGRLRHDQNRLQRDASGQPYYNPNGGFAGTYPPGTGGTYPGGTYPGGTVPNAGVAESLQPHPQYPGYYYYASNPGQLYYYPGQVAPAAASTTPAATPTVAANSRPVQPITVRFVNPEEYGVAMNFAIDGAAQSVPSGFTQTLDATSTSVIEFNRGEGLGNARYSLSAGTYEFQFGDDGWQCFKKASPGLVPNNVAPLATNATPNRGRAMAPGLTRNAAPTDSNLTPTTYRAKPPAPAAAASPDLDGLAVPSPR